jgi:hypothetical protein
MVDLGVEQKFVQEVATALKPDSSAILPTTAPTSAPAMIPAKGKKMLPMSSPRAPPPAAPTNTPRSVWFLTCILPSASLTTTAESSRLSRSCCSRLCNDSRTLPASSALSNVITTRFDIYILLCEVYVLRQSRFASQSISCSHAGRYQPEGAILGVKGCRTVPCGGAHI